MNRVFLLKKCPLTDLNLKTESQWNYKSDNCTFSIGIFKKKILLCKVSGKFKLEDIIAFCNTAIKIIKKYSSPEKKLIFLNDFQDLSMPR